MARPLLIVNPSSANCPPGPTVKIRKLGVPPARERVIVAPFPRIPNLPRTTGVPELPYLVSFSGEVVSVCTASNTYLQPQAKDRTAGAALEEAAALRILPIRSVVLQETFVTATGPPGAAYTGDAATANTPAANPAPNTNRLPRTGIDTAKTPTWEH